MDQKNIMKRNRLLALLLTGAMTLGLAACGPKEPETTPEAEGRFTPGTYTGKSEGFYGEMTVEVTLDAESIVSINVISHGETEGVGTVALEKLPDTVAKTQSLAVDAVSSNAWRL